MSASIFATITPLLMIDFCEDHKAFGSHIKVFGQESFSDIIFFLFGNGSHS